MTCEHRAFRATVGVTRMSKDDGGPITGYMAEVRVACAECGKPFQFLGLAAGLDTQGARVSLDGLEANIAITPQGTVPSPLARMAYGIERHQ